MIFFKTIAFRILDKYLKRKGVKNDYIRRLFIMSFIKDWRTCDKSIKEKIWAFKRGFYPSRIDLYGLTNENYRRYLSDLFYSSLFPINQYFQNWIDDKLTTRYILQDSRLKVFVPKYFIFIDTKGRYSYLMDFDQSISKDSNTLFEVLKKEKMLAMKPVAGSQGKGFIKLELKESEIYANGKPLNLSEFEILKSTLNGYLVTEYCSQHSQFNRVWPKSECTLRIVMSKIKDHYGTGETNAFISYARFGSSISNTASNMSQGGFGVPFDFESGIFGGGFYCYKEFAQNGKFKQDVHPDTQVRLEGERLPNWDIVKQGLYDIIEYMSPLEYFGFDVIITEDGFKIPEINSMPHLVEEQIMFGPILDNEFASRYFNSKSH